MAAPKGNTFAVGFGRPERWTPEAVEKEAKDILIWANKHTSIILKDFATERNYAPSWLTYMSDKNNSFSEALKIAKGLVSSRREKGALRGELDAGIVKATLATYDDEHRAMLKEMRQAESRQPTQVIIERKYLSDKD